MLKESGMLKCAVHISSIAFILFCWVSPTLTAATDGSVEGYVRDAQTGDPLPSATVSIVGTSLGAATDIGGKYSIRNVPAGSYMLRASYIGYRSLTMPIEVMQGGNVRKDMKLEPVGVEGEVFLVTAQARGQKEAINEQIASQQIISVVSSDRIQELPDANAAEAVGRLPGVSILRDGGEGAQVVIRGLAPKYNAVLIDGVRMASSNGEDRSTDLSMISSDMLNGIEVARTVTADQDADVLGGSVNFKLREATAVEGEGAFKLNLLAQGSYTGLPNAYNKFRNYKYVASIENRFFDNAFGVFLQASTERRNLSDNELGATYAGVVNTETDYLTNNITLDNVSRDRQRTNAVLGLDYKLPDGLITLSNFFSTGVTEVEDRQQFYNINQGANAQAFTSRYTKSTLNMITNVLGIEQQVSIFRAYARLSHSYSETKDPNDWTVTFNSGSAGLDAFGFAHNLDPQDVVKAAANDLSKALLQTVASNNRFSRERNLTASVDLVAFVNLTNDITSELKFGGKYRHQTRSYDYNAYDGEAFGYSSGKLIIDQLTAAFPWFTPKPGDPNNVSMATFLDPTYSFGTFLDGKYAMVYPQDFSKLHDIVNYMNANQLSNNITYNYDLGNSTKSDYSGTENISAAYGMATVNLGTMLTITPGVRFQQLKTVYTAMQGLQGPNPYSGFSNQLVTVTAIHPYWLPSVLIRCKPTDWCDVRLAYTNTVSYPDYGSLAPIITVFPSSGTLQWNGFNLEPIRSKNYDAYVSFYDNTLGLLTGGAFLKQITNLIYQYTFTPSTAAKLAAYYPAWSTPPVRAGVNVTEYINDPYRIDDYGMELDWQTHFWYLPQPFSGLVMNVNYTHIFSKAEYPFQFVNFNVRPTKYVDSSYYAPLLYQPDNILNLSLGYDYKGFSTRLSMIYSSRIFTSPNVYPQLLAYTAAYKRWDLALKQELPIQGFQLFCNLNNINGVNDVSVIAAPTGAPVHEEKYVYSVEAGLRYKF